MKVIALYSIKGGVGKTATSVNLAYLAAKNGSQTMLFDLDPQGSASFYFRVKSSKKFNTKVLLKGGKNVDKNIKGTDYEKLDSLPSDLSYRKLDIALDNLKRSKRRLKGILQPYKKEYDYIFIDCPPNITLIAENIFFAADVLLVPIIPTTLSVLTLEKLFVFFKKAQLDLSKIYPFFSMVEKRKKLHKGIMEDVSAANRQVFKTIIPYLADVEKMGIYREPVACFKPNSVAAQAYVDLWRELKQKIS